MFSNIAKIAQYLPTLVRMLTSGCEQIERITEELRDVRREFGELTKELADVKAELLKMQNILPDPPELDT